MRGKRRGVGGGSGVVVNSQELYREYKSYGDGYELEMILHIGEDVYLDVMNGEYNNNGVTVSTEKSIVKEGSVLMYLYKNIQTKHVVRIIGDKHESYIKSRIKSITEGDNINITLSSEHATNSFHSIPSNGVHDTQVSERTGMSFNGGDGYVIIKSIFNEQNIPTISYRIEMEAANISESEWVKYYNDLVYLGGIFGSMGVNISKILKYFANIFERPSLISLRDLAIDPISYTVDVNSVVKPAELLGTPKLDGKLAHIAIVMNNVVALESVYAGMTSEAGGASEASEASDSGGVGFIKTADKMIIYRFKEVKHEVLAFGELVESKFWLFDPLYYGEVLTNKINLLRLGMVPDIKDYLIELMEPDNIIMRSDDIDIKFVSKRFMPMNIEANYDVVQHFGSGPTDGMILYMANSKYYMGRIYKHKPAHMNTIDLFFHRNGNNVWLCYLHWRKSYSDPVVGKFHKELGGLAKKIDSTTSAKFVELDLPEYKNIGVTTLNKCDFEDDEIRDAIYNTKAGNFVVECIWSIVKKRWKIIKIRSDKVWPNSMAVISSNMGLLARMPTKEDFYAPDKRFYTFDDSAEYSAIRKWFRAFAKRYIVKFIGSSKNTEAHSTKGKDKPVLESTIDLNNIDYYHMDDYEIENMGILSCGKGGDLTSVQHLPIRKKLWCWDISNPDLSELKRRLNLFGLLKHLKTFVIRLDQTSSAQVEAQIAEMKDHMDAIIMMYSVHYMVRSIEGFGVFSRLLNSISERGTLFITNIIDAEVGMKLDLEKYNIIPSETGLDNAYGNIYRVSVPFKSAGKRAYSEEPVIKSSVFISIMKTIGWDLVDHTIAEYDNADTKNISIELTDKDDKLWITAHNFYCFVKL